MGDRRDPYAGLCFEMRGRHIGQPWQPPIVTQAVRPTSALDGGLSYGKSTDMSHLPTEGDLFYTRSWCMLSSGDLTG
jgi:hypothetical protein